MAGELFTLPLRLSVRVARATVSGGLQLTGRAIALVSDAVKVVAPGGSSPPPPAEQTTPAQPPPARPTPAQPPPAPARRARRQRATPPRPSPARPLARGAAGEAPAGSRPPSPPAPLREEPVHVNDEPELVAEFAELGAEDGAGAEVTMDEPWDGYDQMPASDLIVRLRDADSAELAAVKLYESTKRRRETVLTAVDREFQTKRGHPNQT